MQLGEWYFCLYRRIEGEELIAADLYGEGSAAKARFVGEVIGQLHLALREAGIEVKEADLLANVRGWALPKARALLRLPNDLAIWLPLKGCIFDELKLA